MLMGTVKAPGDNRRGPVQMSCDDFSIRQFIYSARNNDDEFSELVMRSAFMMGSIIHGVHQFLHSDWWFGFYGYDYSKRRIYERSTTVNSLLYIVLI